MSYTFISVHWDQGYVIPDTPFPLYIVSPPYTPQSQWPPYPIPKHPNTNSQNSKTTFAKFYTHHFKIKVADPRTNKRTEYCTVSLPVWQLAENHFCQLQLNSRWLQQVSFILVILRRVFTYKLLDNENFLCLICLINVYNIPWTRYY
jgi:hypothetical protein